MGAAKPRFIRSRQRWYARIGPLDDAGKARQVIAPATVKTEAEAWEWFRGEVESRRSIRVPDESISTRWVFESYLFECEQRVGSDDLSLKHYESKVRHLSLVLEQLGSRGGRVASSLSAPVATEVVRALSRFYAPNYVANICASLAAALNWAVRNKHLTSNPIAGFEVPTVPHAPERFAERAEAAAFLRFLLRRSREPYRRVGVLLQRTLIHTGARPGELCNLWWSDIRWDARTTPAGHTAARAVIPVERWKSGKKTGKARTIYLSPALTRALWREWQRHGQDRRHVFVHPPGRGGVGGGEPWKSGSVLSCSVRRLRTKAILARQGAVARQEAGQSLSPVERGLVAVELPDQGPQRLTNYRWRHTAASRLLMDGVDVATVATLLGTSVEMIQRTYGHLLDRHLAAAVDRPRRKS